MKVVVIGGTGLIGSQVVEKLNAHGHDVKPAALQTETNTIAGEGVDDATGAEVLINVSNAPSLADDDAISFFTTSTNNLVAAARAASVGHYVGTVLADVSLVPGPDAWLASTTYDDWATANGS